MKKSILYSFLAASLTAFGQGSPDIIWNGTAMREVEPAYRITENPTIIDTSIAAPVIAYPLLVLQYPTSIQVETIHAASIKTEQKLPQLYSSYVKLGIGTTLMPLAEFYFDSKRSRKWLYGAHFKHMSSFGNIPDYAPAQFSNTKLGAYGGINEKSYTLRGEAHYGIQGLHYYGWKVPTDSVDRNAIAQRYQDIGAAFSYAAHKKDSANLNYTLGLAYNYYTSKKPSVDSLSSYRASENYIALNTSAWYKYGKERFALDFNIRHNSYNYGSLGDTLLPVFGRQLNTSNTLVDLKPTITTLVNNNRIKVSVGVDILLEVLGTKKVQLFPLINASYSLFNDIIIPYAGLRGGAKQTTFKSLSTDNEFVLPNLSMLNEKTPIDFYFGVKGTLSKRMTFNASASFARIQNKALYVTDTLFSVGNKFNVIYDTLSQTTLEGSLSYQWNEKLKLDGIGRYYSYLLKNNVYAWNLPTWQLLLRGSYNLYDKFIVHLDMTLEGGRKALVYAKEENTTLEDKQYAKELGTIVDLNLGLEYRYNKRISAFIQFNNFAAQRYKRWYNYPVQAFQVMGGITFRF